MNYRCIVQMVSISIFFFSGCLLADQEGFLTVNTEPSGVEVWLDNNFIGNSPVNDRKMPAGNYEVKLIDPIQKISLVEQVYIGANSTVVVEKTLVSKYGALKVNSVPENADVYLSIPLGKTPLSNEFIVPGKFLVEVRHPDKKYLLSSKNIVVNAGEPVTLIDTLVKENAAKKALVDKKGLLRIGLGAGALASFIWAFAESDKQHDFKTKNEADNEKAAGIRKGFGIAAGTFCIVSFEIVAFF
jgi:hypothetical protein